MVHDRNGAVGTRPTFFVEHSPHSLKRSPESRYLSLHSRHLSSNSVRGSKNCLKRVRYELGKKRLAEHGTGNNLEKTRRQMKFVPSKELVVLEPGAPCAASIIHNSRVVQS